MTRPPPIPPLFPPTPLSRSPFRPPPRRRGAWRLLWLRDGKPSPAAPGAGDTVLSEAPLGTAALTGYRAAGVHWLDPGRRPPRPGGGPPPPRNAEATP